MLHQQRIMVLHRHFTLLLFFSGSVFIHGQNKDIDAQDILNFIPKSGIGGNTGATSELVASKTSVQIKNVFKGDMKAEVLKDGSASEKKCPKDLDCDFGGTCAWRNVQEDSKALTAVTMKGSGKPDSKGDFYSYTDSEGQDPPKEPYGLMVGRKGESKNDVWLVSAPIKEQPGDGYVTLRQWSTFKSDVKVCTRKPGSNDLDCRIARDQCSKTDQGKRPLMMYKIKGPITEPFEIVVKGEFDKNNGGMNLFDDIKYRSELCGDEEAVCGDERFSGQSQSSNKSNGKCAKDSSLCVKLAKSICDKEASFVRSHCQNYCGFC